MKRADFLRAMDIADVRSPLESLALNPIKDGIRPHYCHPGSSFSENLKLARAASDEMKGDVWFEFDGNWMICIRQGGTVLYREMAPSPVVYFGYLKPQAKNW